MLKFALKSMMVRRARMALVALSVIISAGVGILACNISAQVSEGIVSTAAWYDLIIGPSGSATQLAMNTMFFTDQPLGTISFDYVEEIEKSGLANQVVPFAMGDSYNGARIIGTTPEFLSTKTLAKGEMFSDVYEAVIGSETAKKYGLSVGGEMITSHGLSGHGAEHAAHPLIVTGILKESKTAYDNAVFTSYKTVWAVHEAEDEDEEEEEEGEHAEEGSVCAILVRTKGFNEYYRLMDYYSQNASLLSINPSTVLREVLNQVDLSTKIVYILCGVILVMNILVVSVITLLNMLDAKRDIALMRLIGISMKRIMLVYVIENGLVGLAAGTAALLLAHGCLKIMGSFVASMGIVLNVVKFYPMEGLIVCAVAVISIVPTMICIAKMARKDGVEN